MALPAVFLDELTSRCDIVDIISSYVSLQRKGGRYWGCCPFHNEKTPSFSVSPDRQQYYCFGCHKGGGVINFVMEEENLPFRDAVRLLADRAGMTVPDDDYKDRSANRARLLALNKEAARYFHTCLKSPAGAPMLQYLEGRGLSPKTITNFGLGAAPEGWNNLINAMAQKGFEKAELLEVGLAVKNSKGNIYDRFRNRVMFPIIDLRGDVIGFGGRVMDDSTPKYLNSPDSPVFNKSKNLFALNIARKTKMERIILTEGYMDTIALHQAGFDCAVASLGTSLTEDHAQLISRYTKEVVISYDGDAPGINAAKRAITILEKTDLKVRVLTVTGAKDPDEFIKKYGPDAFSRLINRSESQVDYRLDQISRKYNLESDDQRIQCLQELAKEIAGLNSPVEREIYASKIAQQMKLSADVMKAEVERFYKIRRKGQRKQEQRRSMNPAGSAQPDDRSLHYANIRSALAEEGILRLLELDPILSETAEKLITPEQFSSPFLGKVYSLFMEQIHRGNGISIPSLAGDLSAEEMNALVTLMQKPESAANGELCLQDYVRIIQSEKLKQSAVQSDETLLEYSRHKAGKPTFDGG